MKAFVRARPYARNRAAAALIPSVHISTTDPRLYYYCFSFRFFFFLFSIFFSPLAVHNTDYYRCLNVFFVPLFRFRFQNHSYLLYYSSPLRLAPGPDTGYGGSHVLRRRPSVPSERGRRSTPENVFGFVSDSERTPNLT